jgi:hypothetical protein
MQGVKWLLSKLVIPIAVVGRDRRPVVRMGDALNVVERVLLVLPLHEEERQRVLPQLFQFKSDFPQWTLDLLFLGGSVPTTENGVPLRMGVNDTGRMRGRSYNLMIRLKEKDEVMKGLADTLAPICKAGTV